MTSRSWASIRAVLIDLSGTLHVGDKLVEGAVRAVRKLQRASELTRRRRVEAAAAGSAESTPTQPELQYRFVTNTTKHSRKTLAAKLQGLGLPIDESEITSPLFACREYLIENGLRPFLMVSEDAWGEFKGINSKNPNCVVIGHAPEHVNYDTMNGAFHVLHEGGRLLALHKSRYFMTSSGLTLGPGAIVSALEFASGTPAHVFGKPTQAFFERGIAPLGVDLEHACMIGDDVRDDVGGAQAAGLSGILVRTGKYEPGDEANKGVTPDLVVSGIEEAVDLILKEVGFDELLEE